MPSPAPPSLLHGFLPRLKSCPQKCHHIEGPVGTPKRSIKAISKHGIDHKVQRTVTPRSFSRCVHANCFFAPTESSTIAGPGEGGGVKKNHLKAHPKDRFPGNQLKCSFFRKKNEHVSSFRFRTPPHPPNLSFWKKVFFSHIENP